MKRTIVMLTCICALAVFFGRVTAQDAEEVEKPITIDLTPKDIHTALHQFGLKHNLNITVDGGIEGLELTLTKSTTPNELWALLRERYDLKVLVNGKFVYIKRTVYRIGPDWFRSQRISFSLLPFLPVMPRAGDFIQDV